MNPIYHAKLSVKYFGGEDSNYLKVHQFLDQTKAFIPDRRHRLILHNAFGISLCEQALGPAIVLANGKEVATRTVAERHIIEDLGVIPTLEQCMKDLPLYNWLGGRISLLNLRIVQ